MVKPSWKYWSGILDDESGPRFGVMLAAFEAPDVPPFRHASILDLKTQRLFAGDYQMLDVSISDFPEPADPQRLAIGDEHASQTIFAHDVAIRLGDEHYKGLSGILWYEFERRPVKPGSGWRWISMRLTEGSSVMLYDRSDSPARYAARRDEAWFPVEAQIVAQKGERYETAWDVKLGDKSFRILPVQPDQEVIDQARGIRYLEALCNVYAADGGWAGSAYVEIVPSTQIEKRPIVSKPAEGEMHRRWAMENDDAADLISYFGYATQLADDLVDMDRPGVQTLLGRSQVMAEILYVLLVKIPGNPFFRQNEGHFVPLFTNCLVQWDASNAWAQSRKKETRMFAYVQREATARLVEQVAYLVGGFQFAKQVAREIHDYYHGVGGVESFDQYEAERKGARA